MRTLCIEDVASRGGPESCVGVPVRAQRSVDRGVWAGLLSRDPLAGARFRKWVVAIANMGICPDARARARP
jgi:hypothetical protein